MGWGLSRSTLKVLQAQLRERVVHRRFLFIYPPQVLNYLRGFLRLEQPFLFQIVGKDIHQLVHIGCIHLRVDGIGLSGPD